MKLFKKTLWLSAILAILSGVGSMAACENTDSSSSQNSSSSSEWSSSSVSSEIASSSIEIESSVQDSSAVNDNDYAYVYRISVQNETGFGFAGVQVTLKDGDTVIASKNTNASGNANFLVSDVTDVGNYTIVIENVPEGYALPDTPQQTIALTGTETTVVITPTGILQGEPPAGTYYKLGDVVHDFTVTLSDNTTYTLSEVLKEKDLVLLNFWATWCTPCKEEFPAMHNAALAYQDSVSVLAVSTTDTKSGVAEFKKNNAYDAFHMAPAGSANLATMFAVSNIPHSVMIDRYGVVVYNEVGSMPSMSAFTVQFDKFIGEDYRPTIVGGITGGGDQGGGEEEGGVEQMKPNVPYADVNEIKGVLTQESTAFHLPQPRGRGSAGRS